MSRLWWGSPEAARQTNGRRGHDLLSSQAQTGEGLPETIPTDVTVIDTDDRLGVYCEVATGCTPASSSSNAVLHSSSWTFPAATARRTITIVSASLGLLGDIIQRICGMCTSWVLMKRGSVRVCVRRALADAAYLAPRKAADSEGGRTWKSGLLQDYGIRFWPTAS